MPTDWRSARALLATAGAGAATTLLIVTVLGATPATPRKGLAGGDTYIRRSAWAPVICWVDAGGGLGCWPRDIEERTGFPQGEGFATVRVGEDHLCARRDDGEVVCWGWGDCGQGECESPDGRYAVLRTAADASCARAGDGVVTCWGAPGEVD